MIISLEIDQKILLKAKNDPKIPPISLVPSLVFSYLTTTPDISPSPRSTKAKLFSPFKEADDIIEEKQSDSVDKDSSLVEKLNRISKLDLEICENVRTSKEALKFSLGISPRHLGKKVFSGSCTTRDIYKSNTFDSTRRSHHTATESPRYSRIKRRSQDKSHRD